MSTGSDSSISSTISLKGLRATVNGGFLLDDDEDEEEAEGEIGREKRESLERIMRRGRWK